MFLGNLAQQHPQAAQLHALAQELADVTRRAVRLPRRGGEQRRRLSGRCGACGAHGHECAQMLAQPRKAYLLLNVEPELDCTIRAQALAAMQRAEMVVALSRLQAPGRSTTRMCCCRSRRSPKPRAPSSAPKAACKASAAWSSRWARRVRRGKCCACWATCSGVRRFRLRQQRRGARDVAGRTRRCCGASSTTACSHRPSLTSLRRRPPGLQRIADVPIYSADAIVRRAASLQKTRDAAPPVAAMNARAVRQARSARRRPGAESAQGAGEAVVGRSASTTGCRRTASASPAAHAGDRGSWARCSARSVPNASRDSRRWRCERSPATADQHRHWTWSLLRRRGRGFGQELAPSDRSVKTLLLIVCIVAPLMGAVAYLTLGERKVIG